MSQKLPTIRSVTVAKLDINLTEDAGSSESEQGDSPIDEMLWEILHRADYVHEIGIKITTKDWRKAYAEMKAKLVKQANVQHLNEASLSKCIEYNYDSSDDLAMVPVAAYSIQYHTENAWIICYVWEKNIQPDDEEDRYLLSHIRAYLFDEKSCKELDMVTCM